MRDLVQIDIDTALALYVKGYTDIPIMIPGDYYDEGCWAEMKPSYLSVLLEDVVFFASDSKRERLLNPPKPDIKTMKEDIALHYEPHFRIDPEEDEEDDDPDWVETEEPKVESIPDDDAVPEKDRIAYEKPEVLTVEQVTALAEKAADNVPENMKAYIDDTIEDIESGRGEPLKWNARDVVRYHEKGGISIAKLAKVYGLSAPTIRNRINNYKAKS